MAQFNTILILFILESFFNAAEKMILKRNPTFGLALVPPN